MKKNSIPYTHVKFLTCNGSSRAIVTENKIFGIFDSHARGDTGLRVSDGSACFVSDSEVKYMLNIILSNTPISQNENEIDIYQFTPIFFSFQDQHNELSHRMEASCEVIRSIDNCQIDANVHNLSSFGGNVQVDHAICA